MSSSRRLNDPRFLKRYLPLNGHADDPVTGNNGIWSSGSEKYIEGPFGRQMADFDGISDSITLAAFKPPSAITLSALVKLDAGAPSGINRIIDLAETSSSQFEGYRISYDSNLGQLQFLVGFGGASRNFITFADTTLNDFNLHHLVGVFDGTTTRIYLDGVLIASSTGAGVINYGTITDLTTIGALSKLVTIHEWGGQIGDVRMYNIALTTSEVKSLFLQGQRTPKQIPVEQPIPQLPDLTDTELKGAWLNQKNQGGEDYSTAGDDLTAVGAPSIEKNGGSRFDGTVDHYRRAEANWNSADSQGTVCAWIQIDSLGAARSIWSSADEGAGVSFLDLHLGSDNKLTVRQRNAGDTTDDVNGDTVFTTVRWYFVVLTSDGMAYKLYVDGAAEGLTVAAGANNGDWLADSTLRDNVVIGALVRTTPTGRWFGQIRDCRYYSDEKDQSWITYEFARGVPDDSLAFMLGPDGSDISRYQAASTIAGDAIVGKGVLTTVAGAGRVNWISHAAIEDFADACTLVTWFRATPGGSGSNRICSKAAPQLSHRHVFSVAQFLRLYTFDVAGLVADLVFTGVIEGRWYHIVTVWDGVDLKSYVDSVLVATFTPLAGDKLTSNTTDFQVSGFSGSIELVDGHTRDCRVYTGAAALDKNAAWVKNDYLTTRIFY